MSIRARLTLICLVAALLPALPLSLVVESLLDKSFNVGLNDTMEEALRNGVNVSREHFDAVVEQFARDVTHLTGGLLPSRADSAVARELLLRARQGAMQVHGVVAASPVPDAAGTAGNRPMGSVGGPRTATGLDAFSSNSWFRRFGEGHTWEPFLPSGQYSRGLVFFTTSDRSMLLADWRDALLFYHQVDPFFARQSHSVLAARQLFARLRLTQGRLTRSFFYTFSIIYGACVLIALGIALWMGERLARPVRFLADGADAVAAGDWTVRVDARASGETGRLVAAFNDMVNRLNVQRARIAETERLAAWRDVARHLAHEIKNPLLPIRLTIEELRDQYPGGNDDYGRMLADSTRVVGEELGHLQTLVREFSEFARLPDLKPSPALLGALARDVAAIYPATPCNVRDDGVREFAFDVDAIRRVLINFFDNAVSVGATRVDISLREEDNHAVLAFSDNGPGIAPENMGRVFEPYFTTRATGTGIGLAMSRNIVVAHGGTVEAANVGGTADTGGTANTVGGGAGGGTADTFSGGAGGGGAVFTLRLPFHSSDTTQPRSV